MNRRRGAGIAVVVVLSMVVLLVGLVWERARAEAARRKAELAAELTHAQQNLLHAEEARTREHKPIAEVSQLHWEYRVLSIAGSDDVVNQAMDRLTDDRWEYVGVVPPTTAPDSAFARLLFKRMKK